MDELKGILVQCTCTRPHRRAHKQTKLPALCPPAGDGEAQSQPRLPGGAVTNGEEGQRVGSYPEKTAKQGGRDRIRRYNCFNLLELTVMS